MGKSANGPDALDCAAYVQTMDRTSRTITTVLVTFDGSGCAPAVTLHLLSVAGDQLPGLKSMAVSSSFRYPCRESKTFEGALFRAIVEHEKVLSEAQFRAGLGPA